MLSCCRDQIQEVIFFLERVQGHRERLSFSEQMAPASWGERVSLDNTARLHEATDAVLEKTCFCCSLSIDQNRGRSKSRVPQPIGRMHSAGIEAATSAAAEATLRTCRSCGVHGRAGWAASRILPRHPLLHFKGGQP